MIIVSVIIVIFYSCLIIAFIIGFDKVENFNPEGSVSKTKFSIVIPFRDEAQALPVLIKSLKQLKYPSDKFEIIFVDDDSQDDSINIIQRGFDCAQPDIRILENERKSGSPKKDAVETAIAQANFDWVITTDADCHVPQDWLEVFDAFIQQYQPKLIAAPVTYNIINSLLEQFQLLDLLSLQGSTIGGFGIDKPFMCNGANLCYEKQAFLDVNGFEGNEHIASGDDIFLLEKMIANYPDKVHFLKSDTAIIRTKPEVTLKKLISQRIRWAAKATSYKNNFSKLVSIAVFSMNLLLIILFLGNIIGYYLWLNFIIIFLIKFCLDFMLLFKTAIFFKQQSVLKHYFWSSFLYPPFTIFIALSSFTSSYSWKGRTYKK
ncbi:MAG: glycosyltransferase [Flavobacteriaceae bacterium]|nr:glycosyltransferase [Flavobacteriaceae bacterium]